MGQDQKQHVEMTRDLAVKFNMAWDKEILVVPEPKIVESVAIVPGIDGQKMSKSYNNTIELFQTPKQTKKQCGKIVTDSTPLVEPKDPTNCNVIALLELLTLRVRLADSTGPLMVNLHRMVASLVRCYCKEAKRLEIPRPCSSTGTAACG